MSTTCAISPGLVTGQEREELLAEASRQRPPALRTNRPGWRVVADRQFLARPATGTALTVRHGRGWRAVWPGH